MLAADVLPYDAGLPILLSPMLLVMVSVVVPSVVRVSVVDCAALEPAVKLSVDVPSVPPPLTDSVAVPVAPIAAFGVTVTNVAEPVVPVLAIESVRSDAAGAGGGGGGATLAAVNECGLPEMMVFGVVLVSCTFFRPDASAVSVKATATPGASVPLDGVMIASAGDELTVHVAVAALGFVTRPETATPTVPVDGRPESVRYGVAAPLPHCTRAAPGLLKTMLLGISRSIQQKASEQDAPR